MRIVVSLILVAQLLFTAALSQACTAEASDDGRSTGWMDVRVIGNVSVGFRTADGDPLQDIETDATRATEPPSHSFDLYNEEPVMVQIVLEQPGEVTVEIVSWHLEEGGFMGGMSQEFGQRATFEIDEPAGARIELTVARDDDFRNLVLQIDRDADGTVDAEQPPTSVTDEE